MTRPFAILAALALTAGLVFVGCAEEMPAPPDAPTSTPEASADDHGHDHDHHGHDHDHDHGEEPEPVTADDVKKELGEAVDATTAFAAQEKDKFVDAAEERLSAWKNKLDALAENADEKSAEWSEDAKVKYDAAVDKLGEVKEASGGAWVDVKDGFTKAYDELEAAAKDAASNFGDGDGDGDAEAATDDAMEQ